MEGINKALDQLIFGLDIGTRSVVGTVGYMEMDRFHVIAHSVKEHETRAMQDGQIHDIQKVGETIGWVCHELERQLGGRKLTKVCIAAAGRVLKTVTVHVEMEHDEELPINSDDVYSLDSLGIEKAYEIIRSEENQMSFYCVGYTVVKYYMNDYEIQNLEGHRAKKIGADVLGTFLPNDVVDGLYAAVELANLEVASLTLEPIAAMNVAIPEQYRLLNIALVDVGAGTSDICITKDGSIIAYGMIPYAGDELTETIVHECLVEFKVAEEIKRAALQEEEIHYVDIMGLEQTISPEKVRSLFADAEDRITKEIADKIVELNGGKSVSAVFVVGGGGKVTGFTDKLADYLGISRQRVALRGKEVLGNVDFDVEGVEKDPLVVTPIGICTNHFAQKNNFIFVQMNEVRIKLYDNGHLSVVDAAVHTGFPNEDLFAKRGKELVFTVNGVTRMIRGERGEAAVITINGRPADLHSNIQANDVIEIKASTAGMPAKAQLSQLREYREELKFMIDGKEMRCPKVATVNGKLVTGSYEIQENDDISIPSYNTVRILMEYLDLLPEQYCLRINGRKAALEEAVYENCQIEIMELDHEEEETENWEEEEVKESEEEIKEEIQEGNSIHILVNDTPVELKNKENYTFVDIFDFYPFDTSQLGGDKLITKINGRDCTYFDRLEDGDSAELYWLNNDERN